MGRQIPLPISLAAQQDFEEYFPGCNAEAVSHLRECALGGGESLIYLWGSAGAGKSHLLNASCRLAASRGRASAYLPLGRLAGESAELLDGLEELDLICLDDVQAIVGQSGWELAIFNLFNGVRAGQGRLLVAANQPAGELGLQLPDLTTRLNWGLTLLIRPLEDAEKLQALALYAQSLGMELPDAVGRYLLAHYPRDLSALKNLLEKLDAPSLQAQRRLSIPFLKTCLGELP
jgi:DnaA family protein